MTSSIPAEACSSWGRVMVSGSVAAGTKGYWILQELIVKIRIRLVSEEYDR